MKKTFRKTVAGLAASALAAGALTAPQATAEEPKTTDVNLPLACYVYPKGGAAFLRRSLDMGNDFALSMKATAPETVEVGDEFEYVIDPGTVVLPTEMKAQGQTVEAKYISQANLWIDLPDNVELVSFDYDKTTPLKFNVLQDGNRLRFVGENRHPKSVQVGPIGFTGKPIGDNPAEWVSNQEGRWFYGGAQFDAGDTKKGKLPKVTLKLKATGAPGSTAQATIRNADAKNNPPEAFVQGLLNGKIETKIFGVTIPKVFNGLARCGLSEDYTGSGAQKASATPFPAVTIVEKPELTPEPEPTPEPSEEPTPEPPSSEPTSPESETPKESEPSKSSESSTTETKPSEDPKPSTSKSEPTKEPEPTKESEPTKEPPTSKSEPTKDPETPKESTTSTTSTTTTSQAESSTPTKDPEPSKSSESSTTETKPSEDPKPSSTKTEPTKEPEPSPTKPSTSKSEPTKESETPKESTTSTTSTTTTSQAESTTPTKESEPSKETETSKDSETSTTEAPSSETEPTKEPETATETTTPTTSPTTTTTTTPAPQNGSSGSSDGSADSDFSSNPVRKGLFIAFWVALGLLGLTAFGNWLKQHCDFKWPF